MPFCALNVPGRGVVTHCSAEELLRCELEERELERELDERALERELEDFFEELLCCTELVPSQSRQTHSTMPSPWPWNRALV